MKKFSIHASTASPEVSSDWIFLDKNQLKTNMYSTMNSYSSKYEMIEVLEIKNDGQIIVNFRSPVGADKRGGLLLDLEELLKREFDQGITVWLEPLGDKNSLRNLRGIEVKKHE
jgi:hypothetical protein